MKLKHYILSLLALLASVNAFAETVKIDGIWYNLIAKAKVAEVAQTPDGQTRYSGAVNIPKSVTYNNINYSVTSIGSSAFYKCSSLTSVTIPNSVTSIGYGAFESCSGLTSVTIPNSVTSIGNDAFFNCSGLTSVTIPNSVTSIGNDAFFDCSSLTSVTIPNSVTSIGSWAFSGCSGLTSVTIPNSVTSIGNDAFFKCSSLTSITIPNSVTSIGGGAFYHCSSLTSITIGSGVTSIGEYAFYFCSGLTSVTIPEGVTSIDSSAFYGCSGLTSVTIPSSVTSIGDWAFYGCSVKDVYCYAKAIPSTGNNLFFSSVIASATLHVPAASLRAYRNTTPWSSFGTIVAISPKIDFVDANVKAICVANWDTDGDGELSEAEAAAVTDLGEVFRGNTEITSFDELQYFTRLTSISKNAFNNCRNLSTIIIPSNVTEIGMYAFRDCNGFSSINLPKNLKTIGEGAFWACRGLLGITIPSGVTSISKDAFDDCNLLADVNLPEGLTYIGDAAFLTCPSLTSIVIPNSIVTIDTRAFQNCKNLNTVKIGYNITSIKWGAFDECENLTSVTVYNPTPIPIDPYVFSNSANATLYVPKGRKSAYEAANYWKEFNRIVEIGAQSPDITFADAKTKAICVENWDTNGDGELSKDEAAAVTDLGEVFRENKTITSFNELQYFTGLTIIGEYAFQGCSGLTSVTIPNSVSSIGNSAFKSCSSLTSVTIPNSVTSIGSSAFYGCSGLTSVTIPNSVTSIGDHAFYSCSSLTSLSIPESVTSIGNFAFKFCSSMTSITIPNSVTDIGRSAFENCSGLTSITIPGSVTSIGDWAFYGCSSMKDVYCYAEAIPSTGKNLFFSSDIASATLHVPAASLRAYRNTAPWSNFGTIVAISATIDFADANVKALCVANWDTNGDGKLNEDEAAAVTDLEEVFKGNTTITSFDELQYFTGLTSIGNYAFSDCSGLTSVTIPKGVTYIGNSAFSGCSGLTSVTIPNSVTSIGERAFYGCKLLNVLMKRTTPIGSANSIFDIQTLYHAMLYVPTGYWKTYAYDESWYQFINIREITMTEEEVSMQQAYTLMDARTFAYSVYDPVNDCIGTINSAGNIDENNPNHSWQMIETGGMHYLYNMGAKKFVRRNGNAYELTDAPEPIELANGDKGLILGQQADKQWALVSNERLSVSQSAIEDVITGVSPVLTSPEDEGQVYNLAGQRLSKPTKGINIQNGRKFIIK